MINYIINDALPFSDKKRVIHRYKSEMTLRNYYIYNL